MKTLTRTAAASLMAGALLLAGCGSSDDASTSDTTAEKTTTTAAAELEITDVWARQSPMGTSAGAVYLTITSPIDDALVGASVPTTVAGTTEIHETVVSDGDMTTTTEAGSGGGDMGGSTTTMAEGTETTMAEGTETTMAEGSETMTMKPVDSIELPAGETVNLEPGGYHVMLLELVKPLEVGESIEVTLTFEQAGEKTVTAEVRES